MTGEFPPAPPRSDRRPARPDADEVKARIDALKAELEAARQRGRKGERTDGDS